MGHKIDPAVNGRAAGKSVQEIKLENELKILDCIRTQGWVREFEVSLITGLSMYTVGQVCRRLNKMEQISRLREHGDAGHFLRLLELGAERVDGKSGKDIEIPKSWRHDAMAIQTLHHLSNVLICEFETEASMQHSIREGKYPDGRLLSSHKKYYFEQEGSRKSGPALRKQTEVITQLAASGTECFVAYPYPPERCGGINHEIRQTNSIRHKWGRPAAPDIKLVRCHFDSHLAYQNMHVSRFEFINLPAMVNTPASRKGQPGVTDQVKGFRWVTDEHRQLGDPIRIDVILTHNGETHFEGTFTEGRNYDEYHILEDKNGTILDSAHNEEKTLGEFVLEQQKGIERQIEDIWREGNSVPIDATGLE